MSFNQYNSTNYLKYLNDCDLNYKYFLKSISDTPKFEKISLELPTNLLPNIETTEDDYQNRLLLKCFLALYFISFKKPFINCNKFKNKDIVAGTKNSFHYSYLVNYLNDFDQYSLLSELFNENDSNNKASTVLTNLDSTIESKTELLNVKIEINVMRLSGCRDILNTLFTRSELQKLKLKLNIVFKNSNNKMQSFNEIKHFMCLWNI